MKTVLSKYIAFAGLALLMLASCKKDEIKTVTTNGKGGALSASATTLVLTRAAANDTVITISFTPANYGYKAAVTNTLQIDVASDNWANPQTVTLDPNTFAAKFSKNDFNNLILKLKIAPYQTGQIQARVSHAITTSINPVYTNVLSLTVTPFALTSYLYITGAYEGWNPGNADSVQSATGNGVYTGVIAFTPGNLDFKITPTKLNFDGNLGDAGGGTTSNNTYTTSIVTPGNNITAPTKPTIDPAYNITTNQITINTNNNTIVLTPTQWGIVGDATPGSWPNGSGPQSDTNMKFDNGNQYWYVKVHLIGGKQIKFRLNHDWGTNFGGSNNVLVSGGDNINITTTGDYLVIFDPVKLVYSITPQ